MTKKYPNPKMGDVVDNWTVIDDTPTSYKKYRSKCYKVQCRCGNTSMLPKYQLFTGVATQCGSCGSKSGSSEHHLGTHVIAGNYLSNCKHRAKLKNWKYDLTADGVEQLYVNQGGLCALTGIPIKLRINSKEFEFTASLDRIDSKGGYTMDNVQWVHKWINSMKSDLHQSKFIELCRAVVTKNIMGVRVLSRLNIEGVHRWLKCPIEEVEYLQNYHRHQFHITCSSFVSHSDRDVEFIEQSHAVREYLDDKYYSSKYACLMFGDMSCEMIASELFHAFGLSGCEVNEDGEGGAIIGVI